MQNDIRAIYEEMCDNCKVIFRKIIVKIRNNSTKDVNNLAVFFNCNNNKYTFFWKNNLFNETNKPKVPIIDQTIALSQETINKTPTQGHFVLTKSELPMERTTSDKQKVKVKPVAKLEKKVGISLTRENKIPVNNFNMANKDHTNNEKVLKLVSSSQLGPEKTRVLFNKEDYNSTKTMQKILYAINRKMQLKIWSLVIVLLIIFASFGIGTWQLYRHFSKSSNNEVGTVIARTKITSLGGDLNQRIIEIDDKDSMHELYYAFVNLPVGTKAEGKLDRKLWEAIKDRNTTLKFKSKSSFQENGQIQSVIIVIDATKAINFDGTTEVAIRVKSKRINLKIFETNLKNIVVEINKDAPATILASILANSDAKKKWSSSQLSLLNDILTDITKPSLSRLVLKINDSLIKTQGKTSDIILAITSNNNDKKYKGAIEFSLKVKWTAKS